jgi:hypothetical protein
MHSINLELYQQEDTYVHNRTLNFQLAQTTAMQINQLEKLK